MAIINNFGTVEVNLDKNTEEYVVRMRGCDISLVEDESLEQGVSSVLRQVGLRLIQQKDGLHPSIRERMERDNGPA